MIRYGLMLSVAFVSTLSWAQRDPFAYDTVAKFVEPLYSYPLTSIATVGIIVASDKSLAIVRSPDETFHIVGVGSVLGEEKKPILLIDEEGIHIDGAEVLLLPYRK